MFRGREGSLAHLPAVVLDRLHDIAAKVGILLHKPRLKILEAWAAKNPEVFPNYFAGKWGPDCVDRLLEREGRAWRNNLGKPE